MPRLILIVDDSALNRLLLKNTLSKDYDIIEAENGKDALALLNKNYKILSAVLLDIVMPEMDGYEVLTLARENPMTAQIPIIMVTGSEDEESRVKSLILGANDFILKPFNPEIVKHCVKNNIVLRETASTLNAIQKDKLTGLYNREAFFDKATALIKEHESGFYILSCFDIDNFKLINDRFGAAEGDRILREIGRVVKEDMDICGGIGGRISSDNFAVLLPSDFKHLSITRVIRQNRMAFSDKQAIVFSVGRYIVNDTALPASAIYDRAFIAKRSVKGRYDEHIAYFSEEMLEKLVSDQQIITDMDAAIAEHQFEIWFQPQYNHSTGAMVGAEALVRWNHPKKGLISPAKFIPVFEQNGFIYELDKYVWGEACRYLREELDAMRSPLPISVNISRYDMFRADFLDYISWLVNTYDIPIELLRLEVTESAFAESTKHIIAIVKELIRLGFTIEIDDFGSGYSSLNTLKSVPAQVVKLDMRFFEDDDDSQRSGNIIESVVRMTKWLGMSVIAEGVELVEQADYLRSIGCDYIQGYLYAKPMPEAQYRQRSQNADKENKLISMQTVEHLDNCAFWNPKSIDTLIFNSFVGSACIFELCGSRIDMLRATEKYARVFGSSVMTVNEALRIDWSKHLDAQSAKRAVEAADTSLANKCEVTGEYVFLDLPGCPHETHLRATIRVIAVAGERRLIYCTNENITAQRQAEAREHELSEKMRLILQNVKGGICAISFDENNASHIVFSNDSFHAAFGYTKAQMEDELPDIFDLIHPDDREMTMSAIKRLYINRKPGKHECRLLKRDGSTLYAQCNVSVKTIQEQDIMLVAINDVTDLIDANRRATKVSEQLQAVLENVNCGITAIIMHGESAEYLLSNDKYYSLLGYTKAQYQAEINGNIFKPIFEEDRTKIHAAVNELEKTGTPAKLEYRAVKRDGSVIWLKSNISLAHFNGVDEHVHLSTYVEITDEEISIRETLPVALGAVMNSQSGYTFVKDKELRYVCCSNSVARLAGRESDADMIGKCDYDFFDKALADVFRADDEAILQSGKPQHDNVEKIDSTDGVDRYACTSKYPLTDSRGNIVGIYGIGRDVTDDLSLKSRFELLANSIPGGIATYEYRAEKLRSLWVNDGFCRLFCITRDEYINLSCNDALVGVFDEDKPTLTAQSEALLSGGDQMDCVYRVHTKNGGYKWINLKASLFERDDEHTVFNAVLFDVTGRQENAERLRIRDEENSIAMKLSKSIVCRYSVFDRTLSINPDSIGEASHPRQLVDVPYSTVRCNKIAPESETAFIEMFEDIVRGKKSGECVFRCNMKKEWRWLQARYETIFSDDNAPVSAVIAFADVTKQQEREAIYKKWQQSLDERSEGSFTLLRCNINKDNSCEFKAGELIKFNSEGKTLRFNERARQYAKEYVFNEDIEKYLEFANSDTMLVNFYRKKRSMKLEYRELQKNGGQGVRWLRLTVELVEYPNSPDICAFMLYEDIDEQKQSELLAQDLAQNDPLTGLLNRNAFITEVTRILHTLRTQSKNEHHALLMLDIDNFKHVNDIFGHGAGDQTLIDIAQALRSVTGNDDIVCRLGGDEFVIFLRDIADETAAIDKARQICAITRKAYSFELTISTSIGIAMIPENGSCFKELYQKADSALYYVKGHGKDNFALYSFDMRNAHHEPSNEPAPYPGQPADKKRRVLVVDDSPVELKLVQNILGEEFIIDKATGGNEALSLLALSGSAISVVLLDLMMPDISGFEVLEKIRSDENLRSVPVIIVSDDESRETCLKAIRYGATDFITKPIDPNLLRIRIHSAISKAENERLRAQNSYLRLQSNEEFKFDSTLNGAGVALVEYDIENNRYIYFPSVKQCLAGSYDGRVLSQILIDDGVADQSTVKALQALIKSVAADSTHAPGNMEAMLKTIDEKTHRFRINVRKLIGDLQTTDKVIVTFIDTDSI